MRHFQHLGGGGVILLCLSVARGEGGGRKCDSGSGGTRGVAGREDGYPFSLRDTYLL